MEKIPSKNDEIPSFCDSEIERAFPSQDVRPIAVAILKSPSLFVFCLKEFRKG